MQKLAIATLACLLTQLACFAAQAAETAQLAINGRAISFGLPERYCLLEQAQPLDSRLLAIQQKSLKDVDLLALSASCDELTDWRAGTRARLENVINLQVGHVFKDYEIMSAPEKAAAINDICAEFAAMTQEALDAALPDNERRIRDAGAALRVNESKFLGVLGKDENGCYIGVLQKIQTAAGNATVLTVTAQTVLNGRVVVLNHVSPGDAEGALGAGMDRIRSHTALLNAANPTGQ